MSRQLHNPRAFPNAAGFSSLAFALQPRLLVKAPEFDSEGLLERIATVLGDCRAIGSLNCNTGGLSVALPRTKLWAALLAPAAAGMGPVFPGVRLGAVAAMINKVSTDHATRPQLHEVSVVAEDSRIVFQRCPWDEREVLFAVLPENAGAETNFALLRLVLESVRRDVAIVRAPRIEERCWN